MIKALADNIVLKKITLEQKTSQIIVRLDSQQSENIAEVIAIGDKVENINVGDKVVYAPYSVNPMTVFEDKLIFAKTSDVLGIIQS